MVVSASLQPPPRDLEPAQAPPPGRGELHGGPARSTPRPEPITATVAHAIAQAIADADVAVCTHVPGYGGTEVFASYRALTGGGAPHSFHEEPAYAVAHGAGVYGARAACLIKSHGFAKAMNAVLASLSAGTRGGVVVLVFDDRRGAHSDNVLDGARLLACAEIPFATVDRRDPYAQVRAAFLRSERLQLPVALLVDCADIGAPASYAAQPSRWRPAPFASRPYAEVVCPLLATWQRAALEHKLEGAPRGAGEATAARPLPALPEIPDGLPGMLRDAGAAYVRVFAAFEAVVRAGNPGAVVSGDAGTSALFAFPPYAAIDVCTYMGGSVPLAIGARLGGAPAAWAISGDFSFVAGGPLGLLEAELRGLAIKLLLLDNGRAAATGDQATDARQLARVLAPYLAYVRRISATASDGELRAALAEADAAPETRIVVVDCSRR